MRIRILALLICLVSVLSLWGCNSSDDAENSDSGSSSSDSTSSENKKEEVDLTKYDKVDVSLVDYRTSLYSAAKLSKGYESLKTEEQKKCYDLIDETVSYVSKEAKDGSYPISPIVMENMTFSEAQLHLIISAYSMDHPHIFWLESQFAYYSTDEVTYLQLNSGLSAKEIESDAKKLGNAIENIFQDMPGDMSDYQKELYLHDKFLNLCEYADTDDENTDDFRIYTSIGGLVDNYAVCEGYSRSMQILLSLSGIETYYVFGEGNDNLHMWNMVNIDGVWYHLDSTWNDSNYGIVYDYFNLTDEELLEDHSISPSFWDLTEDEICGEDKLLAVNFNLFLPETGTSQSGYYAENAIKIVAFDENNIRKIADGIIKAMDRGEDTIYLYFDPAHLVYATAVDTMLYKDGEYTVFDAISEVNDEIYYAQLNDDYVEVEEFPEENVISISFEYSLV